MSMLKRDIWDQYVLYYMYLKETAAAWKPLSAVGET